MPPCNSDTKFGNCLIPPSGYTVDSLNILPIASRMKKDSRDNITEAIQISGEGLEG